LQLENWGKVWVIYLPILPIASISQRAYAHDMTMNKVDREKVPFPALLRSAGFKATPGRLALLETLAKAKKPLPVDDILASMKRVSPDPATVYRALKELKDAGVIRHVDFQHGHAHYELGGQTDHHHLVCIKCEKVEDFTGCDFEAIRKAALRQSKEFKEVKEHALELFGLCKSCSRK